MAQGLFADPSFERDALDFFPTPLADTLDEAAAETSSRAQRDRVVEALRVATRLLGVLALVGLSPEGTRPVAACELLKKFLRQGLTEGEWIALTREIVRPYAANAVQFPFPALVATFFDRSGAARPAFAQQGACDKLLAMRKSETVAHGVSGTEETAESVLTSRLPDLECLLHELSWIWKLPLIVPERHARLRGPEIEYSVLRLQGVTPRRGFRPQPVRLNQELVLGHVYALRDERHAVDLHPFVQHLEGSPGQLEVFLFDEVHKREVQLRAFPSGQKRADAEAFAWLRDSFLKEASNTAHSPGGGQPLAELRAVASRVSLDYLDKMQRERIYLPHVYARRLELERHLSGFLDPSCTKTGLLVVGGSGAGKTNTLCHIVKIWAEDPAKLGNDVVLLLGGSLLPGGGFSLRDIILDRLEITGTFPDFLATFAKLSQARQSQLVVIVDGVDKHTQPAELLRQLDDLVVRGDSYPWFKVVTSIGEVTYGAIRRGGFIPAIRDYYTVVVRDTESPEVHLGPLTDEELVDAYEKYCSEPGFAPLTPFNALTDDVKNAIRNPLFLRLVVEVFNKRWVPRRTMTAEVLLEYCSKKVFSEPGRTFFVNRLVDVLYDNRWTAARFDALAQLPDLRQILLDTSPQSPYLQLLDDLVLEEQLKRVSAILPPQRTVAFTYDRLLEYLLLNRLVDRVQISRETFAQLSQQAIDYLPLRGALKVYLLAKTDEGAFSDVAAMLAAARPEVAVSIGSTLLLELEQMEPSAAQASDEEIAASRSGRLIDAVLTELDRRAIAPLLDFGNKLLEIGSYRLAGYLFERISPLLGSDADPADRIRARRGLGEVLKRMGRTQKATDELNQGLEISRLHGMPDAEQAVLDDLGVLLVSVGEHRQGRDYLEASLQIDRELVASKGDDAAWKGTAQTLSNLALAFLYSGELDKGFDAAEQAQQIFSRLGETRALATVTAHLGMLEARSGRNARAIQRYNDALSLHRQVGDRSNQARDLRRLGLAFRMTGAWDVALSNLREALGIYAEIGDQRGTADTQLSIGEVHRWSGEFDLAMQHYQQALAIYERMDDLLGVEMCTSNVGATFVAMGRGHDALEPLTRAEALQRKKGRSDSGVPETLAFLSAAAWQAGRPDDALQYSDAAVRAVATLRFAEEDLALVYWFRHEILRGLGRTEEAKACLDTAQAEVMRQAHDMPEAERSDFLKGFPLYREIVNAWEAYRQTNHVPAEPNGQAAVSAQVIGAPTVPT